MNFFDNKVKIISFNEKDQAPNEFKDVALTVAKEVEGTKFILNMFKSNTFRFDTYSIKRFLTHYWIWKELAFSSKPFLLILEAGVELLPNFKEPIKIGTNQIIFLVDNKKVLNRPEKIMDRARAYIITKGAAKKVFDWYKTNLVHDNINHELMKFGSFVELLAISKVDPKSPDIEPAPLSFDGILEQLLEEWVWFSGQDFHGSDIKHQPSFWLIDLVLEANKLEGCVAFNTLGYFKKDFKQNELISNSMINPGNSHGIWVKKNFLAK